MFEPFEYAETISTTLQKLAKHFPNSVFKLSAENWYHQGPDRTVGKLTYSLYDEQFGHVWGKSLEEVFIN